MVVEAVCDSSWCPLSGLNLLQDSVVNAAGYVKDR